jgi:hypothetical protein
VPVVSLPSRHSILRDIRLGYLNESLAIFCTKIVFRREDFCFDDWEDAVIYFMCMDFSCCPFFSYLVLRRSYMLMNDGCKKADISLVAKLLVLNCGTQLRPAIDP